MCFSEIIKLYYRSRRGTRLGNNEYTFSLPTIYVWLTDTSESNSIGKYSLYIFKTIVFDFFLIIYFKIFNGRSKLLAGFRFKWKMRFPDACICFLIIRINTRARVHFVSKKRHVKKHVTSFKYSRKTRLIWHLRFVGWPNYILLITRLIYHKDKSTDVKKMGPFVIYYTDNCRQYLSTIINFIFWLVAYLVIIIKSNLHLHSTSAAWGFFVFSEPWALLIVKLTIKKLVTNSKQ